MDSRTTWPALIGALIRGEHLAADETAWAMNEIMDGAATPAQIAGFGVALRIKGETAGEVTGLAQAMLDHARRSRFRAGPSTWSAPAETARGPSTSPRWAPSPRRRPGHGWSSTATAPPPRPAARLTCSRRWAWSSTSRRPRPSSWSAEIGAGLPVRAAVPPGAAARDRAAPRARRADGLQRPRPGGQPGPAGRAGAGRGRPADGPDPGRGAGRPRLLGAGLPRRRRPGRADHDGTVRGLDRARRHRQRDPLRPCRARHSPVGPGGPARRRPGAQRRGGARVPGRRRRSRCGRPRCSTPAAALAAEAGVSGPEALAPALADGYQRAAAAVDSGAAADLLDRWVAASNRLAGR